jgi:uncharacterized protein YqjF (DUF2071 family)
MTTLTDKPLTTAPSCQPSAAARQRMLSRRGEPLFLAGWRRVLMMHFEVDRVALQRDVPFPLDLYHGRAFVSLVAFSMERMRPRFGGRLAAQLFRPIATHDFLNVRTYVIGDGEPGIHFLAEWLTNRLAVRLAPRVFGLPYHFGQLNYDFKERFKLSGQVTDCGTKERVAFTGALETPTTFAPSAADSLTEWLMERYTAFNAADGRKRFFRVWHPPWPQCTAAIRLIDRTLLAKNWPWFHDAKLIGANYSPGFDEVWMGRPHKSDSR